MCLLPLVCGWQVIYLECEPKCMAILAQGLGSKFPCCLFLKAMSVPMDIDKETEATT